MKKAIVILTALLLIGCGDVKSYIKEVCIGGVVYLVYNGIKQGGITPKINADYYPYTCNTQTTAIPQ